MDHNEMLKMQRQLDDVISKTHNLNRKEIMNEKNLALLIEFAEFSNELAAFKYWKNNKQINPEAVYEEFADVLHFIFSFFLSSGVKKIENIKIDPIIDVVKSSNEWFKIASNIVKDEKIDIDILMKTYSLLLSISKFYNLDDQKIQEAYIKKNKINFKRIKNNY